MYGSKPWKTALNIVFSLGLRSLQRVLDWEEEPKNPKPDQYILYSVYVSDFAALQPYVRVSH